MQFDIFLKGNNLIAIKTRWMRAHKSHRFAFPGLCLVNSFEKATKVVHGNK